MYEGSLANNYSWGVKDEMAKMSVEYKQGTPCMTKLLPLIAISLFTVICVLAVFFVDPVLSFLRYWAAFGVVVGILLFKYLWDTDEI